MDRFDLKNLPQPRDLTKAERDQWHGEATLINERQRAAQGRVREGLWDLAHALYDANEASIWVPLGYETKEDWLRAEGISPPTFRRFVSVWREMVVVRQLDRSTLSGLDPSKIQITLPLLTAGEVSIERVVEDVKTSTARELREEYRATPPLPPVVRIDPPSSAPDCAPTTRACAPEIDDQDELAELLEAGRALITADPDMTEVRRVAHALLDRCDDPCPTLIGLLLAFDALSEKAAM